MNEEKQNSLVSPQFFGDRKHNLTKPRLQSARSLCFDTSAGKLGEQKGQQQKQDSFHSLIQNFVPGDILCHEENHA